MPQSSWGLLQAPPPSALGEGPGEGFGECLRRRQTKFWGSGLRDLNVKEGPGWWVAVLESLELR